MRTTLLVLALLLLAAWQALAFDDMQSTWPSLPRYACSALPAAGAAGRMVAVSDGDKPVCVSDGTSWLSTAYPGDACCP